MRASQIVVAGLLVAPLLGVASGIALAQSSPPSGWGEYGHGPVAAGVRVRVTFPAADTNRLILAGGSCQGTRRIYRNGSVVATASGCYSADYTFSIARNSAEVIEFDNEAQNNGSYYVWGYNILDPGDPWISHWASPLPLLPPELSSINLITAVSDLLSQGMIGTLLAAFLGIALGGHVLRFIWRIVHNIFEPDGPSVAKGGGPRIEKGPGSTSDKVKGLD